MRVLLVGRHFWPHGTIDAAGHLIQLATGMHRAGVHVEVMAPRFSNRWAQRFVFREFNVHRPVVVAKNDWGASRYLKHTTQWLQTNASHFDAIMCVGAGEESIAVIDASRQLNVPSIIQLMGRGAACDLNHLTSTKQGRRTAAALKTADQIVVASPSQHRALVSAGFAPEKICRVATSVSTSTNPTEKNRTTLREKTRYALAAINSDLFAASETPVALCIGPMTSGSAVEYVTERAMQLLNRMPQLSLWLVGDGPRRDAIHKRLRSDGLRQAVAIPGSFGTPEDLFAAADLYLQPDDGGMDFLLPAAIAAGLPIVAGDSPATREFFSASPEPSSQAEASSSSRSRETGNNENVFWFDKTKNKGLRGAVEGVLKDLSAARERSDSLRVIMQRTVPLNQSIGQMIDLIGRLRKTAPSHPNEDKPSGGKPAGGSPAGGSLEAGG